MGMNRDTQGWGAGWVTTTACQMAYILWMWRTAVMYGGGICWKNTQSLSLSNTLSAPPSLSLSWRRDLFIKTMLALATAFYISLPLSLLPSLFLSCVILYIRVARRATGVKSSLCLWRTLPWCLADLTRHCSKGNERGEANLLHIIAAQETNVSNCFSLCKYSV